MSARLPIAVATTYSVPRGSSCPATPLASTRRSSANAGLRVAPASLAGSGSALMSMVFWLVAVLLLAPLSARAQGAANTAAESAPLVLLLPSASTPFGSAGDAVRQGFFAAHKSAGSSFAIQVVELNESGEDVTKAIDAAAARGAKLVIGPLSRPAVDAVARAPLPAGVRVLALNTPSQAASLPEGLLAFGLPIEDEASGAVQFLVQQAALGLEQTGERRYVVVAGRGALADRAARAFSDALSRNGEQFKLVSYPIGSKEGSRIAKELAAQSWRAMFLALSAGEAGTLRPLLGAGQRIVGTSRLHLTDRQAVGIVADLEGVHFVDMPWLIDREHPVVARYPRPAAAMSAELERLYALGIDAYRLSLELLGGATQFEVDGVTGWLRVDPQRAGRVERLPTMAVFRKGKPTRTDVVQ
jgi:uncharacterized protein